MSKKDKKEKDLLKGKASSENNEIKETKDAAVDNEIRETGDVAGESIEAQPVSASDIGEIKENPDFANAGNTSAAAVPSDNNEIRETTGASMEIYDEDDSLDLSDSTKKKKFKKRFVVIPVLALAAAGAIFAFINSKKATVMMVETTDVALGSIENVLSISGTVESGETKSYFSHVAAPLATLNVKVGDKVKKGDLLYTFDEEALDLSQKTAELAIKQAKGTYSSQYDKSPAATEELRYVEGMTMEQIQNRLDAIEKEIDFYNHQIEDKKQRMQQTLNDLNKLLNDYNQNGVTDSAEGYAPTDRKDKDGKELYLQTQNAIKDINYAMTYDDELVGWKRRVETLTEEKSHLTTGKSALGSTYVKPGTASSSKASLDSTKLNQEDNIEKLEEAREGVRSDFNGVVTAIPATVMEGASVTNGTQILTLANLDDVLVSIQVSKSDLPKIAVGQKVDITINGKPYSGTVDKISGNATKNTNGVAVVDTKIRVTNPDSEIILGVEANNKIHAQKADNTIVLPYEYVQTDSMGDYVFVVENGMAVRKDVTVGISNSTEAEIAEGLSVGDQVITSDVSTLAEGTMVSVGDMP